MADHTEPTTAAESGVHAPASVIVRLVGIHKSFGATHALNDVSVDIRGGEIHSFVGENGAGKSTLGKVVAGVYGADDGDVIVDNVHVDRWNPAAAQHKGVSMIAQELALVPDLTVAQNVFLGAEQHRFGIAKGGINDRFRRLNARVGFELDPKAKVRDLRIADQQKVEILRSLARNARVIVMDEPTSSLSADQMRQLEDLMRMLRDHGCAVIYVSHFLDSVLNVSDRITVMRDGRRIETMAAAGVTKDDLITSMLGRKMEQAFPERPSLPSVDSEPLLSVKGAQTSTGVNDMSLEVRSGEIVGLLGLEGSGRTECLRAVFGMDPLTGGVVTYLGRRWNGHSARQSIEAGLVLVSEDRHKDGLVLQRSVRENISLASLSKLSRAGVIRKREEKRVTLASAKGLEMRPLDIELPVGGFSGGNQQKALLGKAMVAGPKVIILDEPTRGVDVGAKRTIYELIVRLAADGLGVVLISSEHEEIMELAHRAYLVSEGRTIDEIVPTSSSVEDVLFRLFNESSEQASKADTRN